MIYNQTLHQTPFLRLLLPFSAGISLQYLWNEPLVFYVCFVLSAVCFIFYLTLKKTFGNRWVFGLFVTVFSFTGGCFLTYHSLQKTYWNASVDSAVYSGLLTEYPAEKNKTVLCRMNLSYVSEEGTLKKNDRKVILYLPKDSLSLSLIPGDRLVFRCRFEPLSCGDEKAGFGYHRYLKKQGYAAVGFVQVKQWIRISHQSGIKFFALKCLMHLTNATKKLGLSERSYALGVALLFGYKDLVDRELIIDFSSSGISHLIAVSGFHVQIIFVALCFMFSFMGNGTKSRTVRQLLILSFIWMFTFVAGLSPSLLRAAVMLTIYGIGDTIGKKSGTLNVVFASAFLMLVYDPLYLFDVSFQLSYAAVLAIIIIYPMLERLHETKNPAVRYTWSLFCVSVAAQLGTAPLCLYYFHQFPTYFWLTNMLTVPVVGILSIGMIVSIAIHSCLALPLFIFIPIEYVLRYLIVVAETISRLPYAVIPGLEIDEIQTFFFYGMLFSAVSFFTNRKVSAIYLFQLFLLFQLIYYLWG